MKPIVLSSCLAVAALSLYAADPQTSKDSPAQASTHVATLFSQQTSGIGDSPLVRAAKATNRLGKKPSSQVITNETLVHTGGHFTTTTPEAQALLPSSAGRKPSGPSFDEMAADARRARAEAAAAAEQAKKYEEQKKLAAGRAAATAMGDTPEGLYADPPALEMQTAPMKPISPETMGQKQKPPV